MSITTAVSKDGRSGYRVRVGLGKTSDGSYRYKTTTILGATYVQAVALETRMKDAAQAGKNNQIEREVFLQSRELTTNTKSIPLKNAYDLALQKPHCKSTSEARIVFHRNYWNDFVAFLKVRYPLFNAMQHVTTPVAEEYISFIRANGMFRKHQESKEKTCLSNDTLNEIHRTISQVFRLLHSETGTGNPFGEIPRLSAKHAEREAYTEGQLRTIFERADGYLKPMFFIGLFTGLSEGDVCTLRKDEVHFDRHHIYRKRNKTKKITGTTSAIPMLPVLEEFLKGLIAKSGSETEYVLPEQAADYLRERSEVSKRIKKFLEMDCEFDTTAKLDGRSRKQSVLDFHSLRHTFCSMAGVAGIPITVVQSIVGHMTPRMTELYSRHVQENERLYWIQLLGKRLNVADGSFIGSGTAELPDGTESERLELIELVKHMDIGRVREELTRLKTGTEC